MKYKIKEIIKPQVIVEYSSDDGLRKQILCVRIDKNAEGVLPSGEELDNYILAFAPDLEDDPYEGVDWSHIESKIEIDPEEQKLIRKEEILTQLQRIDLKSIRALRENNQELITKYEDEAVILREELKTLS